MSGPNNPSAFPKQPVFHVPGAGTLATEQGGMTLRDYFAAKAIQGLLADLETRMSAPQHARMAYEYADAMLAERAKGPQL